jgi:hypothetical protein
MLTIASLSMDAYALRPKSERNNRRLDFTDFASTLALEWTEESYLAIPTKADLSKRVIKMDGYISQKLPTEVIESLQSQEAAIQLYVGSQKDTKTRLERMRNDGAVIEELFIDTSGKIPKESFYRITKASGITTYLIGGIAPGTKLIEFIAICRYLDVPWPNIQIEYLKTDYKAVYREALAGKINGISKVIYTFNPDRLARAIKKHNPDADLDEIIKDDLHYCIVTIGNRNILLIDLEFGYGTQIAHLMDFTVNDLGIRDILFLGSCGCIGNDDMGVQIKLYDVISYTSILDATGFHIQTPVNSLNFTKLEEAFSPLTQRNKLKQAKAINSQSLALMSHNDFSIWSKAKAGFVEMELLHAANFLRKHGDVKFAALTYVTDGANTNK